LRRYYPGFFAAAFLVLLRIAIGWHLLAEGLFKIMSSPEGKGQVVVMAADPKDATRTDVARTREIEAKGNEATKGWAFGRFFRPTEGPSFSSEGYQRNASGPFADQFRGLIGDADSRDALDLAKLKTAWKDEEGRVAAHYGYDDAQKAAADSALAKRETDAADYLKSPETREKIKQYRDNLDDLARLDANPKKMSFEVERYYEARRSLEANRKELVTPIDGWNRSLRDAWVQLATEDQVARAGPYQAPLTEVQRADQITMYGLAICGLALMVGLLTPIAALGASAFLMLFYISMPPWPGLPVPPNAEGHYIFVNKNLIEFLACLVIAATPNGLWLGVDALFFGWISRLRARRALRRERAEFDQAVREAVEHHGAGGVAIPIKSKSKSR
jgi:uncharacterized membrane protein YphA (DoxX/SURF4 family)